MVNFLPIVVTILLKQIFLYVAAFPTTVGVALILLFPFIIQFLFLKRLLDILRFFEPFQFDKFVFGPHTYASWDCLNLYINYGLSQVSFLLYDYLDKDMYTSPFKIFKQSWQLMSGNKWRRFLLDLSFIGWFIGVILTLGFLGLYVFLIIGPVKRCFMKI